jgi:hypothetical protein
MIVLMATKSPGAVWFAPINAVRPDILAPSLPPPPHVNSKIQPVSVRALENYCTSTSFGRHASAPKMPTTVGQPQGHDDLLDHRERPPPEDPFIRRNPMSGIMT